MSQNWQKITLQYDIEVETMTKIVNVEIKIIILWQNQLLCHNFGFLSSCDFS